MDNEQNKKPDPEELFGHSQSRGSLADVDFTHASGAKFYANHVGASSTLFDIRLRFSCVTITADQVVAEETLSVVLSPELLPLLQNLLDRLAKNYESTYGKIRVPTEEMASGRRRSIPPAQESQE